MHHNSLGVLGISFAWLVVFCLGTETRAQSPNSCTNANLNGSYGFTLTGWRIPDPTLPEHFARAAVGLFSADGRGNLSGAETKSNNGVVFTVTFTGTYSVLT